MRFAGRLHNFGLVLVLAMCPQVIWLTVLGVLSLLRESLSRCRARTVHMLRIVAYAAGPVGLLYGGLFATDLVVENLGFPFFWQGAVTLAMFALLVITLVIYLRSGLGNYLRLPHATWVALGAVIIGGLFTLVLTTLLIMAARAWL